MSLYLLIKSYSCEIAKLNCNHNYHSLIIKKISKNCIFSQFFLIIFHVSFLLGFVNWNNVRYFRAIKEDVYKKWQSNIYNIITKIKEDYGDNFSDEEVSTF